MKCDCGSACETLHYADSDFGGYVQVDLYWCVECQTVVEE
jgi:hypothetical protein